MSTIRNSSLLSRIMAYPLVRFTSAIILGGMVSVILILLMKILISDYDEMAEDAVIRLMNVKLIVLPQNQEDTYPGEMASTAVEESETKVDSTTDDRSEELKEILRKKEELINTLEAGE